METKRSLVITRRPIAVNLYKTDEFSDDVWVRVTKYFVENGLSVNTASQIAKQYMEETPDSKMFCQHKFTDSTSPEWCVNLRLLPALLYGRRKNSVTDVLWRLIDAWHAERALPESTTPLEEAAQKTKSKSVERRLQIQAASDLNFSVNALN